MKRSIFRSICLVAVGVFLTSVIFIMAVLYDYFVSERHDRLKTQTELVAAAVENEGKSYLDGIKIKDYRITLIDNSGKVLYDSQVSADKMENHRDREEVKEALEKGYGESSRYSDTLLEKQIYSAKKLSNGTVVRMSEELYTVTSLVLVMIQPILIVAVLAVVFSLVAASRLSKKIVEPLNNLDLDNPHKSEVCKELQPMLEQFDSQQRQLKMQSAELRRKQEEFNAATNNMNEGLVLLNDAGIILSINQTAAKLLSISRYCIGKDILLVNNSLEIQELLRKAKHGENSNMTLQLGGLEYQMNASSVVSDGKVTGIALLIFDVTEKEKAEQMRREFTANVSHELKTPLHSISGYAELLKNGMVKENDTQLFSKRIYSEAQRMIALVDDIIGLSLLDEGILDMNKEDVDLYELAKENIRILQPSAEDAKVTLTLAGKQAKLHGVVQLLSGIIYNLCDNAIKYNRENGSVSIEVRENEKEVILTVSDTGIGIPEEHRERIFERFYRVDKSHSKEVGGTGLGLSIVKHAVKLHNAQIELQSVVNGGTTVTVRFPKL